MKPFAAVLVGTIALAGAGRAYAQSPAPSAGTVIVTAIPGGAAFFTESQSSQEPSFANYAAGGSVEVQVSRYVSVEGEITGLAGLTQDVDFIGGTQNIKTPTFVNYNGNVVVALARSSVIPYVTGGVGGLTLRETTGLGINDSRTFFVGNVGAGLKWFNANGRWGVRGDYRFLAVRSDDAATAFFGQETRYAHRVYGGLLINVGR
jgi:hypothetical protein